MKVVVYDNEGYEPLTVVTVPTVFMREMEQGKRDRRLRFAAPMPLRGYDVRDDDQFLYQTVKTVELEFEPIYKGHDRLMWLCTAADAETALLLRSTFLPGQTKEVNRAEEMAFVRGLMAAFNG